MNYLVDLGAHKLSENCGDRLVLATLGEQAKDWTLIACEPAIELQEENIDWLPSHPYKVAIYVRDAVSDFDGQADFHYMPHLAVGSNILDTPGPENGDEFYKVNVVSIRTLLETSCQDATRIVLKIDIEGSEFAVIRQLLEMDMLRKVTDIFVEWHPGTRGPGAANEANKLTEELTERGVKVHNWA